MNCNSIIHKELISMETITCPFCNVQLQDSSVKHHLCCDRNDIINDNGSNVCQSCGSVHGFDTSSEYIDFHENRSKLVRKSVYQRKYHIQNTLNDICNQYKLQILISERDKIYQIFEKIPSIDNGRKRMISIKFLLKRVMEMLKLPHDDIKVTKSKKTLAYYEEYWNKIQSLI